MLKKIIALTLFLPLALLPLGATARSGTAELPVVMYHQLSEKPRLLGDYVLSVDQFESDLRYLSENGYTAVTASQLIAWRDGEGKLPEKPVMITFDDGFESTVAYAEPLLEKYGMTAVVAVIGSVTQQFTDTPDHMLDYSYMSWDAVSEAERGGVLEVQCHTWDMHRLSPRKGCSRMYGEPSEHYRAALSEDIARFQSAFCSAAGHVTEAIALPFGAYDGETLTLCSELGFRVVLTCAGRVNRLDCEPGELIILGRFNRPSGPSSGEFFGRWG